MTAAAIRLNLRSGVTAFAGGLGFALFAVLQSALETGPHLRVDIESRMAARAEVRSSFAGETDCSVALPAEFDATERHLVQLITC